MSTNPFLKKKKKPAVFLKLKNKSPLFKTDFSTDFYYNIKINKFLFTSSVSFLYLQKKCNFLKYYQVVSAIPKHLLERAKQTQLNKTLFLDGENFQLSPSLSINLTKMKNKDYYWLFVKKSTPLVTTLSKWERDLSSNDILWKNYFKQIKFMCK